MTVPAITTLVYALGQPPWLMYRATSGCTPGCDCSRATRGTALTYCLESHRPASSAALTAQAAPQRHVVSTKRRAHATGVNPAQHKAHMLSGVHAKQIRLRCSFTPCSPTSARRTCRYSRRARNTPQGPPPPHSAAWQTRTTRARVPHLYAAASAPRAITLKSRSDTWLRDAHEPSKCKRQVACKLNLNP